MDFQCHNRALKTSTTCSSRTKGEGAEEVELEELAAPARARIRQCSRTGRSQLAYQSVPGTSALLLIEPGDSLRVDTGSGRKGKRLCKCVIDHDTGRG